VVHLIAAWIKEHKLEKNEEMMDAVRRSRLGFVVIKFRVGGIVYYLMRVNPKWKDINFIGGHEKPRDGGDLEKTARRELWEEVPSVRSYPNIELEPITGLVSYGPIYSRSKGDQVEYEAQFFLVKIINSPNSLVELLSDRSKNIWISENELIRAEKYRMSGLVEVLNSAKSGGLEDIPYSSGTDLSSLRSYFEENDGKQLEFALK